LPVMPMARFFLLIATTIQILAFFSFIDNFQIIGAFLQLAAVGFVQQCAAG
jgi:hypothetical protein